MMVGLILMGTYRVILEWLQSGLSIRSNHSEQNLLPGAIQHMRCMLKAAGVGLIIKPPFGAPRRCCRVAVMIYIFYPSG